MRQPLDLNLSSHPFRNNTLLWAAHGVACAALIAFSVWNVNAFLDASRSRNELRAQVDLIEQRMNALEVRDRRAQAGIARHDVKDLSLQASTANSVIYMKALSWTRLFNLLERVVPPEVKTIAVRPSFGPASHTGREQAVPEEAVPVSVQGIAQSIEAFLELERSLIMDTHFDQVEPEKTDLLQGGEIAFEVSFLYYPDGRPAGIKVPDLPHVLEAAAAEPAKPEDLAAVGATGEAATDAPPAPAAAPPPPKAATPARKPTVPPPPTQAPRGAPRGASGRAR